MTEKTIHLVVPHPPSVNTYWGFHGHRRYLTPAALAFKRAVLLAVAVHEAPSFGSQRLALSVTLYGRDRRMRDLDNALKPLLDALQQAGLFDDDSQIDQLSVARGPIQKGGKAEISIRAINAS
jgi:crossover junction endodeoxyribonuclease RusA